MSSRQQRRRPEATGDEIGQELAQEQDGGKRQDGSTWTDEARGGGAGGERGGGGMGIGDGWRHTEKV